MLREKLRMALSANHTAESKDTLPVRISASNLFIELLRNGLSDHLSIDQSPDIKGVIVF